MSQIDPRPARKAADMGDDLELHTDGVVYTRGRRARPTNVAERRDLPVDHPLHGRRLVRVVPAGYPDCEVGPDGRLVPVDIPGDDP